MNKLTVIIPTLWKGEYIHQMLERLNPCPYVDEILLIDNAPNGYDNKLSKVRHIQSKSNLYVNGSWNFGVSLASNNLLLLLSDDVEFDVESIPRVLTHLTPGTSIGVHKDAWHENSIFNVVPIQDRPHSWGVLVFTRKDDWVDIPDELKIWFGDDWIVKHTKKLMGVTGINIKTYNETTSGLSRFNEIKRNDVVHWYYRIMGWPLPQTLYMVNEFKLHMNNCIFTTHHTLTEQHAIDSLSSLFSNQTTYNVVWDNFIIYNTHPDEIPNDWLVETVQRLDEHNQISNLLVFPYEDGTYPKTLTQDTINHFQILVENEMNLPGKTLLLKSDYCVSNNFNEVFSRISTVNTIWSLPIHNAKEKVSRELIFEKLKDPEFRFVDAVTYYRGGTNYPYTPGSMEKPYDEQSPDVLIKNEMDPRILFVSHNIQNDYNLHVFTNDTLTMCLQICKKVYNTNSTWGGAHDLFNVMFTNGYVQRCTETDAFGVHMYHGIISPNRNQDRTDPRKVITGERY